MRLFLSIIDGYPVLAFYLHVAALAGFISPVTFRTLETKLIHDSDRTASSKQTWRLCLNWNIPSLLVPFIYPLSFIMI